MYDVKGSRKKIALQYKYQHFTEIPLSIRGGQYFHENSVCHYDSVLFMLLLTLSLKSLVREPLKTRRELLRSSFNEIEGVGDPIH